MCLIPGEPFHCALDVGDQEATVMPAGELDLATVGVVEQQLREARAAGLARIVLDLRALTFIDSTGVRLVLTQQVESERDRLDFVVIQGRPNIARVFAISGVLDRVNFTVGRDDACAEAS